MRETFFGGLAVVVIAAVVSTMFAVIPSHPVPTPATGSLHSIDFKAASKTPSGTFFYGPYFATVGERLYMIGSDGQTSTVYSSADGSSWDAISDKGSFGGGAQRFVVLGFGGDGNGGLVAVGDSFTSQSKVSASAWHSRDGRTWSQAPVDFPQDTEMVGLAGKPGTLVSAGNGLAWYSSDGSTWTAEPLPNATGYVPKVVTAWDRGFVILAVSSGTDAKHTAAWVSQDGKNWTRSPDSLAGFQVQDVVGYGGGLVAVGSQILTVSEIATPSPIASPTPTSNPSASHTRTPKPTATPKKTATPSGAPTPTPTPSPTPIPTVQVAMSWISLDGLHWYRGYTLSDRQLQGFESITQLRDSLVATGSAPGDVDAGAAASNVPFRPESLWTSDDGLNWKPMASSVASLTRSRLTPFGQGVVLSGVGANGKLALLTGQVTVGQPLPPVLPTPTPPFSVAFAGSPSVIAKNLSSDSTLGPVTASSSQFIAFINSLAGSTAYSSVDGQSWSVMATPGVFAGSSVGTPTVNDAIPDNQGGAIAVGSIATDQDTSAAAIWRLSGSTWAPVNTFSSAPSALGSIAQHGGTYVAAAQSADGPRLIFSRDGKSWGPASIFGADAFILTVTAWSGGFVASGLDDSGVTRVWTSKDGMTWQAQSWKLPANAGTLTGAGSRLITTTTGVTGATSWWWSSDGQSWRDAALATSAGCFAQMGSGYVVISAPAGTVVATPTPTDQVPIPTLTPTKTPKPKGSTSPAPTPTPPNFSSPKPWLLYVSKDATAWQQPIMGTFGFDGGPICQSATLKQTTIVIGWLAPGYVGDYYGPLSGL